MNIGTWSNLKLKKEPPALLFKTCLRNLSLEMYLVSELGEEENTWLGVTILQKIRTVREVIEAVDGFRTINLVLNRYSEDSILAI